MMRLRTMLPAFAALVVTLPLAAQQNAAVRRARAAYDGADFAGAMRAARAALAGQLAAPDRAAAYEVLGYAYAALDSTRQAVAAFRELIFIDPDREPDVSVVSPRITSLYASALGQVLVVRHASVDSASFVAGQGGAAVRFQVTRSARVTTRALGQGLDIAVDSALVAGTTRVDWNALTPDGAPVPPGDYQIVITAVEGRNEYAVPIPVHVTHGPVDTLPHLTTLPGYDLQPESVRPPRDWRPLGLSALFAGLAAGATLALENQDLGSSPRREIGGVTALVLGVGLVMSLRRPDPQPVEANIRYNQLIREQLAQRNATIAAQNDLRRRQVRLTVTPAAARGSP
jgi:tetratricopeptide (TPR) repeat protein